MWEVKCNNGLIGYSTFMPQMDFSQGVEKASYRIELPAGQQCRYRTLNTDGKNIQVKESTGPEGQQILEVSAAQLPPIVSEPFGPSLCRTIPARIFRPFRFQFRQEAGRHEHMAKVRRVAVQPSQRPRPAHRTVQKQSCTN